MNENMPRGGDALRGTKAQLKDKAADLASGAKEQARAQYDAKKDVAVGELGTLASSLRRVVDDLSSSHPNNMSGKVVSTLADRLETFSQTLEGKDLDNVVSDVERFARRNPAAFLGGAVALGFIASRFLKSSAGSSYGSDRGLYNSDLYDDGYTGGRTDSAIGSTGYTGGAVPTGGAYSRSSGSIDPVTNASGIGSTGSIGTTGSSIGSTGIGTTGTTGTSGTSRDTGLDRSTTGNSDLNRTGRR